MLNVLYKSWAMPLVWLVVEGRKGHFNEARHRWLIDQLQPFLPEGVEVVFWGWRIDGIGLQQHLAEVAGTMCAAPPRIPPSPMINSRSPWIRSPGGGATARL